MSQPVILSQNLSARSTISVWIERAGWLILGICAAGLALLRLGANSLWLDEAYTWYFSRMDWFTMLEAIRLDGHPPLYWLLSKIVISLAGESEAGLRLFSGLTYLAGIVFIASLGQRVGGRAGRLAGAWFWVFHPMALYYARDARSYMLVALFSAACLDSFLAAQASGGRRPLLAAGLFLALGLVVHYFCLLVFAITLWMAFINLRRGRVFFRRWTVVAMLATLPFFGWLWWFSQLENPSFGIGWIQSPGLADFPLTVWNLFSGYGGMSTLPNFIFGGLSAGLVLFGLWRPDQRPLALRWLVGGLLLPVAGVWAISLARPFFVDRYFIVLLPVVALLVSLGAGAAWKSLSHSLAQTARLPVAIASFFALLAIGFYSGWQVHTSARYFDEDWRGMLAYLVRQDAGTPLVLFSDPAASLPFAYYAEIANFQYSTAAQDSSQVELFSVCRENCWWPVRQPYTVAHAFTQSITDPARPWLPEVPPGCRVLDAWESSTHLALWYLQCQ